MTVERTQQPNGAVRHASDRPRRRYAKRLPPEQRRAQLLDAAFTVLSRVELHELSMEAVAQEAGVGKPVLYTVFSTRAELVAALLERERERGLEQVTATLPGDLLGAEPATAASATIEAFVGVALENPTRWRLILATPASVPDEYRAALRESRAEVHRARRGAGPDRDRVGSALGGDGFGPAGAVVAHGCRDARTPGGRRSEQYPRERLADFVHTAVRLLAGVPPA